MMPERRKRAQEDNVDSWLMSYADMITLLLCFFIVFVSVSEPKKEQMSKISEGLQKRFGVLDLTTPYQGLMHSLETVTETHRVLKDVSVAMAKTGVEMELASDTFFQKDSANFVPDKLPVLLNLAATIKAADYIDSRITIEGHSSDAPVSTPMYQSNWELSSARAGRLVRLFIDQGIDPVRMRAVGYGDSMPKVPNLDAAGQPIPENRIKNERILIKIDRMK